MSCPSQLQPEDSDSSDYGSDFSPEEEVLLNELVTKASTAHAPAHATQISTPASTTHLVASTNSPSVAAATPEPVDLESLQPTVLEALVADIEDGIEDPPSIRLPKVLGREKPGSPWKQPAKRPWLPAGTWNRSSQGSSRHGAAVEHPSSTEGRERERERSIAREHEWTQERPSPTPDLRSPVERFRRAPNKAFSVTDLVSPAWCELQYWYTLTKHGRKRRTPAMKKGSVMHKTLEDEIYTTVPVEITTKEDAWALRIWNVIQGLRLLREYGVTRELEVWGVVDGEIVNGIIDQLSYECPDSELESTASSYYEDAVSSRDSLPEYQMSLSDFLLSSSQGGRRLSDLAQPEPIHPREEPSSAVYDLPRIYMTDVKTRASGSAPTIRSTSFRPTLLQLQLYYHLLNRLITSDDVTMDVLAARYNLDTQRLFTDGFISEVGGLNDEFFDTLTSQEWEDNSTSNDAQRAPYDSAMSNGPDISQDSTSLLSTYGNLSSLWGFMKDQLRLTFLPALASQVEAVAPSIPSHTQPKMLEQYPTLLSPVLTARYLSSVPTEDSQPRLLGSRSFLFDTANMTSYLTEQMEWWRGDRDPRGVGVAEAWKCQICEFRDECSWRQEREWFYARRSKGRASADI
ncbi:hypothetical protein N7492_007087 [Penicillium capsulatum]|uniref:Uncharacterized protein n=1 Tax=Penicillium capsulatum TaxID=69766 RepID=A0A9W9I4F6_9EURO|nr:hypothetical protein N7492_007087 [Penicillium capsulatum]KAJ6116921.1 hypothetical protein N7512_006646 [Penicillium capsulatum]